VKKLGSVLYWLGIAIVFGTCSHSIGESAPAVYQWAAANPGASVKPALMLLAIVLILVGSGIGLREILKDDTEKKGTP
jgi:hypothetical protein